MPLVYGIIISMFFDSEDAIHDGTDGIAPGALEPLPRPTPGRMTPVVRDDKTGRRHFQDEREYKFKCAVRAKNGYDSGMGEIFRKVSDVSPINEMALLPKPSGAETIGSGATKEGKSDASGDSAAVCNEQTTIDEDVCNPSKAGSGKNQSQLAEKEKS